VDDFCVPNKIGRRPVGKKRSRRQHGVKMETLRSIKIWKGKVVTRKRCVWCKKIGFGGGGAARSEKEQKHHSRRIDPSAKCKRE